MFFMIFVSVVLRFLFKKFIKMSDEVRCLRQQSTNINHQEITDWQRMNQKTASPSCHNLLPGGLGISHISHISHISG